MKRSGNQDITAKYNFSLHNSNSCGEGMTPPVTHRKSSSCSSTLGGSSIITPLEKSSFVTPGYPRSVGSKYGTHSSASIYTPRSSSRSVASTPGSGLGHHGIRSSAVVSLVEGRGLARGEIGMASIDLKSPTLYLSQFPDSQTYIKVLTKLLLLQPIEIILPNTVCDGGTKTKLYQLLSEHFDEATLTTVQRRYFNESKGIEYIHHLCASEFASVEVEISTKYYCLAASAALLKYVEFIQNIVYAPNSLRVCFKGSDQTAVIDVTSVKNLEILSNARDHTCNHSLYGILNYTKTIGGARLLRSNILEPPSSADTIRLRQKCVQELTENEDMFYGLEAVLKRFLDIDHLTSLIVTVPKRDTPATAENTVTNVIHLKHVLQLVEPLQNSIAGSTNSLLRAFHQVLDDIRFKIIMEKIQLVVHEDTQFQKGPLYLRAQKCFCIKSGLNAMLDISRQLYTEVIDDISALTKQISEEYNLPVKSAFSASRGFFLQLYVDSGRAPSVSDSETPTTTARARANMKVEDLPREFLKVTKHRSTFSFTTVDLIKLNTRASNALDEIYSLSHKVLKEMLSGLREHVGCLYRLAESVAMLDMLHSFSHLCTISDYTCPEFTDTLAIKQGRHPILDKIAYEPPIPNNAYASKGANFVIITGPNMCGKSTFLRQIALLQIMAQIGCFVPAEYASFKIVDQIYSRIGSDDDIETNASTFMVEMREVNYILQNVSDHSLVIIDELGRATSAEEGLGLCYAICEQLLNKGAHSFLATHFLELYSLSAHYQNVEIYHFQLNVNSSGEVNPNAHVLMKGVMEETNYGLRLAKMSSMPADVLDKASSVAAQLSCDRLVNTSQSSVSPPKEKIYELGKQLIQTARNSLLDADALRSYLKYLKQNHWSNSSSPSNIN